MLLFVTIFVVDVSSNKSMEMFVFNLKKTEFQGYIFQI